MLLRRLAALAYDLLVLGGLLIILTFPYLGATVWLTGTDRIGTGDPFFQLYLAVIVLGYFGLSWRFGGQTLGMRAWRLHALSVNGGTLSWPQIVVRATVNLFGLLLGGLGYWWALIDRSGRTAGECCSHSVTRHYPKPSRESGDSSTL